MTKSLGQAAAALALAVLGVFPAGAARAEAKARLVYARGSGTTECPTEIALRLSVIARLGYDPFSPQASRVVLARIERRRAFVVGVVELVDQDGLSSGRRELSAPRRHCDELARAMALSISLSVDPERARVTHAGVGDGEDNASPASTAGRPEPVEVGPAMAARAPRAPRLYAGGALAGGLGLLPSVALGGGPFLGTRSGAYSLQLEARFMQSLSAPMPGGGSLSGTAVDPGVAGCRSFEPLGICLVTQLGVERLRSHESSPRSVAKVHAALGPRLLLHFAQSGRLSWLVGLEGLTRLSLKTVRMHDRDVWTPPPFSGTILVGAEADFL